MSAVVESTEPPQINTLEAEKKQIMEAVYQLSPQWAHWMKTRTKDKFNVPITSMDPVSLFCRRHIVEILGHVNRALGSKGRAYRLAMRNGYWVLVTGFAEARVA